MNPLVAKATSRRPPPPNAHTAVVRSLGPAAPTTALDVATLRESAASACRLLKTLSNPDRLLLLCQLSQGEKSVGELEALLGIGQPTLSQQLGVLREEGLVSTRREGKHIHYTVASAQALAVMGVLYQQFCSSSKETLSC
jgi:DNA-binding transcriptional ArsR family regulator